MSRRLEPTEGYWIFYSAVNGDHGYEKALDALLAQVKNAEKTFKVTPISNASVKDSPDSREVSVAFQTVLLEKR
jgi:hypothetical protein